MMAKARIDAVIRKLPESVLAAEFPEYLHKEEASI